MDLLQYGSKQMVEGLQSELSRLSARQVAALTLANAERLVPYSRAYLALASSTSHDDVEPDLRAILDLGWEKLGDGGQANLSFEESDDDPHDFLGAFVAMQIKGHVYHAVNNVGKAEGSAQFLRLLQMGIALFDALNEFYEDGFIRVADSAWSGPAADEARALEQDLTWVTSEGFAGGNAQALHARAEHWRQQEQTIVLLTTGG